MYVESFHSKYFGEEIHVGDKFFCIGENKDWKLKEGLQIEIVLIDNYEDKQYEIGVYAPDAPDGWHDLDEEIDEPNGYYFSHEDFVNYFRRDNAYKILGKTFYFAGSTELKGRRLTGLKCKVLKKSQSHMLLEFEENIGGSSGDGIGKSGHCLISAYRKDYLSDKPLGKHAIDAIVKADKKEESLLGYFEGKTY